MAIRDADIDLSELKCESRKHAYGCDSTPLMAYVPDPPPSHWGKLTSTPRTASPQYIAFLKKHKEVQDGRGSAG